MKFRAIPKTALVAFAAGAVACVPALGEALALDRSAVLAGEAWRWVSGHFVHWGRSHAFWDIATFAVLGIAAERLAPRRAWLAIALAVPLINAAFWYGEPALATYRGLSGIDCALAAFIAADLFRGATDTRSRLTAAALALFLAGKIAWELTTTGTLFVESFEPGVVGVPVAHAAGAIAGAAVGALRLRSTVAGYLRPVRSA